MVSMGEEVYQVGKKRRREEEDVKVESKVCKEN